MKIKNKNIDDRIKRKELLLMYDAIIKVINIINNPK